MQPAIFKKVIGFLGLVSLVLFGAIYFVYNQIKSKSEKIAIVEHDLSQTNNRYDYLVSTQRLISDIAPQIEKASNSIVSKNGDVSFIENLESLAKSYNLQIQIDSLNIAVDSKAGSSTPATLKIKAKTEGSWTNSYLFLSEIESMPIKIKINRFAFDADEDIPSDGSKISVKTWKTSFEISVLKYQ